MKKTATVIISMLAVVLLAMTALVGCGSSSTVESLEGTSWKLVSGTDPDGKAYTAEEIVETLGASGDYLLTFKDGQATGSVNGQEDGHGAYTYEDGKLTITELGTGTVEGNKLTFVQFNNYSMILEKQ